MPQNILFQKYKNNYNFGLHRNKIKNILLKHNENPKKFKSIFFIIIFFFYLELNLKYFLINELITEF